MAKVLVVIGILTIIIAVVLGITSGSFVGFLVAAAGGVSSSVIFFALASILDNQQLILTRIQQLERPVKLERTCPKCSRQYDGDMHSCPHCGYRD